MCFLHLYLLLFLVSLPSSTLCQRYSERAWEFASEYLQRTMNTSYKECENFYDYVCGGLESIDPEKALENEFDVGADQQERIRQKLHFGILDINKNTLSKNTPKFVPALRDLFDECVKSANTSSKEKLVNAHDSIGQRLGYLPIFGGGGGAVWNVTAKADLELGIYPILTSSFILDEDGKPILYITPSMPEQAALLLYDLSKSLLTGLNAALLKKVSKESIEQLSSDIADLHEALLDATTPKEEEEQASVIVVETTVANLTNGNFDRRGRSSVDWKTYVNAVLPSEVKDRWLVDQSKANVRIEDYKTVNEIGKVLAKHKPETVFSYVFILALADTLYGAELESVDEIGNDDDFSDSASIEADCTEFAYTAAPSAAARLLLEMYGVDPIQLRNDISFLVANITSAFQFLLLNVSWLEPEDKAKIMRRVGRLQVQSALPNWIMNNDTVMEMTPEFDHTISQYENDFRFKKKSLLRQYKQTLEGVSFEEWEPDFEVNAFYLMDTINVNLGYSLPPFFDTDYPLSVQYGGLGSVIGHELYHSVDPQIVTEEHMDDSFAEEADDKATEARQTHFISEKSSKKFEQHRKCVIDQYSKYCDRKLNVCIQANTSVNEDEADINGVKIAYTAYKMITQMMNGTEPPLPGFFRNRTGEQLFFYSFARSFCGRKNDTSEQFLVLARQEDPHSPTPARVDLSMADFDQFAAAFKCPNGGRYSPAKRCSWWSDLEELLLSAKKL